ncbi:class C sortase [Bifidobacterium cuniculi]|uniref:Sortase family protein n=1 Tax=Bifidobacterium cuniculi TaxID=1688 RepID=A0A087B541_9BIFI|nr:class C sortase [Bifidobacterium cuniculi]KFI66141.1 sortase family protein [Bifidobacterium cuniculi]
MSGRDDYEPEDLDEFNDDDVRADGLEASDDVLAAGDGRAGHADAPQFDDLVVEKTSPEQAALKKRKNRQFWVALAAMCALLLVGVGLILYPTIADAWNRHVSSKAVASYVEAVEDTSQEERDEQLKRAKEYNESLVGQGVGRFLPTEEEMKVYDSILDPAGVGIMGYITIPKIKTRLPIYHGTSEAVLQIAAGHMPGSSFPVGGESTHAVITGHTGLPSAMLFTGLDTLEKGDTFTVTVYDDVLTYQVDDINVVLPDNTDPLAIQEGRDLVSLMTCTPYGVNSHRLIVTGHRIPTPATEQDRVDFKDEALRQDIAITVAILVVTLLAIGTVLFVQVRRRKVVISHHAHRR